MNETTIVTIMTELLGYAGHAWDAATTVTAPAIQFVTVGPPAQGGVQGEQLTVYATAFRPVFPFPLTQQRAPRSNVVPAVDLAVEVWRTCYPTPNVQQAGAQLASPTALQSAALRLYADLALMGQHLAAGTVEGGIFATWPKKGLVQDVAVGVAIPLGPSLQYAGWRFPISVGLTGIT